MANTNDAAAGWEIFRNSGFALSLVEINERLEAAGYSPVAQRTYDHYRRLHRRGFRRYLSINRLDTMGLPDPFVDESIRSRYAYSSTNVPTQLVLHLTTEQAEVFGRADVVSDMSCEIVVDSKGQQTALRETPPSHGTSVTINFLDPPETAYGAIDFVSVLDANEVRIGIVFKGLIPVQELTGATSLEASRFRFTITAEANSQPLDVVSQDLYWLLQAIEASRGLVNLFLDSLTDVRLVSPVPTVEKLTVASPLDAWLKVSIEVYLILDKVLDTVRSSRDNIREVVGGLTRVPLVQAQAELVQAQADNLRAQTEGIRIDNARKEQGVEVLSEIAAVLVEQIRERGLQVNLDLDINAERLEQLYFKDLEPSVKQLAERGLEIEQGDAEDS